MEARAEDRRTAAEEETALALAQRTYLYELFHTVLGQAMTGEQTAQVFSRQTVEAVAYARELLHHGVPAAAGTRATGVPGAVAGFSGEGGHALHGGDGAGASGTASDDGAARGCRTVGASSAGKAPQEAACSALEQLLALVESKAPSSDDLRAAYQKLFEIPGPSYVHPWESVYVNDEPTLFQESTLDVRRYYHAEGFKLQAERHFPDDHIAAMADFMARMGGRAYERFADGEDATCAEALRTSRSFLRHHLLTWIDEFAGKVREKEGAGFYAAFAGGFAAWVRVDEALLRSLEKALARC